MKYDSISLNPNDFQRLFIVRQHLERQHARSTKQASTGMETQTQLNFHLQSPTLLALHYIVQIARDEIVKFIVTMHSLISLWKMFFTKMVKIVFVHNIGL